MGSYKHAIAVLLFHDISLGPPPKCERDVPLLCGGTVTLSRTSTELFRTFPEVWNQVQFPFGSREAAGRLPRAPRPKQQRPKQQNISCALTRAHWPLAAASSHESYLRLQSRRGRTYSGTTSGATCREAAESFVSSYHDGGYECCAVWHATRRRKPPSLDVLMTFRNGLCCDCR